MAFTVLLHCWHSDATTRLFPSFSLQRIIVAFLFRYIPLFPSFYLQRIIVAFPKLFHLATLNLVDDWDDDACSQVSLRPHKSCICGGLFLPQASLRRCWLAEQLWLLCPLPCIMVILAWRSSTHNWIQCFMQVSTRILESPEALCLDPSVFVMAIQSCVAMHGIAQKVSHGP